MTQKELDIIFAIIITVHENEWFGKRENSRDRNEVQKWVATQLAESLGIYTIPMGSSWGNIVDKETYVKYQLNEK